MSHNFFELIAKIKNKLRLLLTLDLVNKNSLPVHIMKAYMIYLHVSMEEL